MTGEVIDKAVELESAIAGLQRQINEEIERRGRWLNEWALLVSPWKVGEVCKGQGYTFTKANVRVTAVSGRLNYDQTPKVQVVAVVLKNDGSDSIRTTDWTWVPDRRSANVGGGGAT